MAVENPKDLATRLGREWAEDRWNRVFPWRHEYPFLRPGYEKGDALEAEERAKSRGLLVSFAADILTAAVACWSELQNGTHGRYRQRT